MHSVNHLENVLLKGFRKHWKYTFQDVQRLEQPLPDLRKGNTAHSLNLKELLILTYEMSP